MGGRRGRGSLQSHHEERGRGAQARAAAVVAFPSLPTKAAGRCGQVRTSRPRAALPLPGRSPGGQTPDFSALEGGRRRGGGQLAQPRRRISRNGILGILVMVGGCDLVSFSLYTVRSPVWIPTSQPKA